MEHDARSARSFYRINERIAKKIIEKLWKFSYHQQQ
jgi:hypothetical protein